MTEREQVYVSPLVKGAVPNDILPLEHPTSRRARQEMCHDHEVVLVPSLREQSVKVVSLTVVRNPYDPHLETGLPILEDSLVLVIEGVEHFRSEQHTEGLLREVGDVAVDTVVIAHGGEHRTRVLSVCVYNRPHEPVSRLTRALAVKEVPSVQDGGGSELFSDPTDLNDLVAHRVDPVVCSALGAFVRDVNVATPDKTYHERLHYPNHR
jgi:hypothetical protein